MTGTEAKADGAAFPEPYANFVNLEGWGDVRGVCVYRDAEPRWTLRVWLMGSNGEFYRVDRRGSVRDRRSRVFRRLRRAYRRGAWGLS